MKRLVKGMLRLFWRATSPVRRPFSRKLRLFIAECLQPTERLMADETNMLMNQVVRELVRMQRQIEELQEAIEDLAPDRAAIAGEIEPNDARRLRAG